MVGVASQRMDKIYQKIIELVRDSDIFEKKQHNPYLSIVLDIYTALNLY